MIDVVIIARALQQTSRLTLPNFGTLLKKPDGEIVFSQFLRDDDMVFNSIVMNSYQVGLDEAKQMVAEFVSDLTSRVNSSCQYIIPEVGYFTLDLSGAVKLRQGMPQQPPQPQFVEAPQPPRPQITPQPIVGIPQQQTVPPMRQNIQQQYRQQPPYGPNPHQTIPPRRPQQRPQPQRPQQPRPQQPRPQQPRPQSYGAPHGIPQNRAPRKPKAEKTDYFLIIAIIVAVAVIILILYSLFIAESVSGLM